MNLAEKGRWQEQAARHGRYLKRRRFPLVETPASLDSQPIRIRFTESGSRDSQVPVGLGTAPAQFLLSRNLLEIIA